MNHHHHHHRTRYIISIQSIEYMKLEKSTPQQEQRIGNKLCVKENEMKTMIRSGSSLVWLVHF